MAAFVCYDAAALMKKVSPRPVPDESTVAAPPRLEMLNGTISLPGKPGSSIPVTSEAILLGRHEDCQLVLDDPRVSSMHAELVATEQGVRLRDKGSKNGTFLGGVRVGEVFLTSRTSFRLAATEVVLTIAPPPPAASIARISCFRQRNTPRRLMLISRSHASRS